MLDLIIGRSAKGKKEMAILLGIEFFIKESKKGSRIFTI